MSLLDDLAESRIVEAQRRGEFDDLPGAGAPLRIDDDRLVPPEWRMAYRVLRNAGYLPPEMSLRKQVKELERLIDGLTDSEERRRAFRRLEALRLAVSGGREIEPVWMVEAEYRVRIIEKLTR